MKKYRLYQELMQENARGFLVLGWEFRRQFSSYEEAVGYARTYETSFKTWKIEEIWEF